LSVDNVCALMVSADTSLVEQTLLQLLTRKDAGRVCGSELDRGADQARKSHARQRMPGKVFKLRVHRLALAFGFDQLLLNQPCYNMMRRDATIMQWLPEAIGSHPTASARHCSQCKQSDGFWKRLEAIGSHTVACGSHCIA